MISTSDTYSTYIFDLDLTFKKYLPFSSAFNIVEYQGLLYIGDYIGRIGIIQKNFTISYFQTSCTSINSLAIDKYGLIAVLCADTTGTIYIYNQGGALINTNWDNKITGSNFIGFDENQNFIVTSMNGINIFSQQN